MAIGSFRGQLESTISRRMGATDDPYKARRESAQSDYQAQASKARKDLSERLNRLGVLRGSGATATQFGEFESGVLRGQQAIGAQFEAQREAGINQALQQGLGLYGTQSQFDLAGRQQSEVERMGLSQRGIMGRGQTEAERMGLYQRTMGGRQQAEVERMGATQRGVMGRGQTETERMGLAQRGVMGRQQTEAERMGLVQSGIMGRQQSEAERMGLTQRNVMGRGQTESEIMGRTQRDVMGRGQAEAEQMGLFQRGVGDRAQTEAERMGMFQRTLGDRQQSVTESELGFQREQGRAATGLARRQQDEFERAAREQERFQAGALTGTYRHPDIYHDQKTMDFRQFQLQERLGLGGLTGTDPVGGAQTEAARAQREQEALAQAELTGMYGEHATLGRQELLGQVGEEETLASQELALRRGQAIGEVDGETTLAAELGRGGLEEQEAARLQAKTIAERERALTRSENMLARNQQKAMQTAQFGEAQLARDFAGEEALADRDLRAIMAQQQANLAGREIDQRAAMQQAQFGEAALARDLERERLYGRATTEAERARGVRTLEAAEAGRERALRERMQTAEFGQQSALQQAQFGQETTQSQFARQLAREEMYGSRNPMDWDQTLGATGQSAQIAAERRRLAEMETAGVSQRGLAERELSQRSAMAAQQRNLEREQLYGRAMTRDEQMSGLGYTGGTLASRELTQAAEQADMQRALAREEMFGYRETAGGREQTLGALEAGRDRALRQQEITQRETMQQAGFEEAGRARDLAREEMYGQDVSGLSPARIQALGGTLESRAQARTLAEMEAAGLSQRGLSEREITQRSALAAEARKLEREQMYGRAMTEGEARTGLGHAGGTLESQALTQDAEQADLQRDLAREEMYGGVTTEEDRARGATTLGRQELEQREDLQTASFEESARGREFAGLEAQRDRDLARTQADLDRSLAEQEMYGGTAEIRLDDLGIDPGVLQGYGARPAIEAALTQRLGRAPTSEEITSIEQGSGIMGRQTLAASEADAARDFEAAQLRTQLASVEGRATEDRALEARRLDEVELAGREGRRLETEALYGGAGRDPRGGTLAAREASAGRRFESGERALDRELTRGEADLQRDLAREEMYGGDVSGLSPLERGAQGTLEARAGTRDYRLRAELGREGQAIDRSRLDLAEQELYGGLNVDPRGGTLAAREGTRAAGFERERLDLAGEAGQREADRIRLAEEELYGGVGGRTLYEGTLASREAAAGRTERGLDRALDTRRTDLAEQELYGYREGAGGYREGTYQAREAGLGREEREGRYGVEDQRFEDALALEGERYTAARDLEAERYGTQRGDYQAALTREAEEREFQRQMQVLEVNRQQEEYGGYFNPREEDILGAQLDPNYQAPQNIREWEDRHAKPTDSEALADWTEARGERLSQLEGDYGAKRDAWVQANPKFRGESDQQYAMRMLTAVRGRMDRPRAEEEKVPMYPREWGE